MRRWQQQQLQRNASIRVGAAEARPSSASRLERTTTPRTAHAMDTLAELERCELMYPTKACHGHHTLYRHTKHLAEDARNESM